MEKVILRNIRTYVYNGHFKNAASVLVENTDVKITDTFLIHILDYCSNAFSNHLSAVNVCELTQFLDVILDHIDVLADKKPYLKSMYFISFFLIKQNAIEAVLKMEKYLCLPQFEQLDTQDLRKLYKVIAHKLHNFIVVCQENRTTNVESMVKLTEFSLKIFTCFDNVQDLLRMLIGPYFKLYVRHNKKLSEYIDYDRNIVAILCGKIDFCDIGTFESIVQNVTELLSFLNDLSELAFMLAILLKHLQKRPMDANVKCAINTIKCFSELLCTFDNYPSKQAILNILQSCATNLQKSSLHRKETFLITLVVILNKIHEYFKQVEPDAWKQKIPPQVARQYISLIDALFCILKQCNNKCSNSCKINCIAANLFALGHLKLTIFKNNDFGKEDLLPHFKQMLTLLEQTKKCSNFQFNWKAVGQKLYNLGIRHCANNHSDTEDYLTLFLQYCYILEGPENSIIRENIFLEAMESLCRYFFNLNDFKSTLIHAALGIHLIQNNEKSRLFAYWAKAKYKAIDLQNYTLVEILKEYDGPLKSFVTSSKKKRGVELLQFELKGYRQSWPNKASMLTVCEHLEPNEEPEIFIETLVSTWVHYIPIQEKKLGALLKRTLGKWTENHKNANNSELYVALLNYIYYHYALNNEKELIKVQVDKNKEVVKTEKDPSNSDDIETNEKHFHCDYDSLKLENHFATIKYLKQFLRFFEKVRDPNSKLLQTLKELKVWDVLMNAAFKFRFQNYIVETLQCLQVCLKLCEAFKDESNVLKCISLILELSNSSSEDVKQLIKRAETIISNLEDTSENAYAIALYYVNGTVYFLNTNDIHMAKEYFERVKSRNETVKDELLNIRTNKLNARFMLLPCSFYTFHHNYESIIAKYRDCLDDITALYSQIPATSLSSWVGMYSRCLIFDYVVQMCSLFESLKLPRELHMYSACIISQAILNVLPLRVAYILYYFAISDMFTQKREVCQSKLDGIVNILCNGNNKKTRRKQDLDTLCVNFEGISLDCGSPCAENVHLPNCLQHPLECRCFFCMNPLYQELTLLQIYLQATLCTYQVKYKSANHYFAANVRVYQHFMSRKEAWQKETNSRLQIEVLKHNEERLHTIYGKTLLEYRDNLLRLQRLDEAARINDELLAFLEPRKHIDLYLYNQVNIYQIADYCSVQIAVTECKNRSSENIENEPIPKTPENNSHTLKVVAAKKVLDTTPKLKTFKTLKFDLEVSPCNSPNVLKIVTPKAKTERRPTRVKVVKMKEAEDDVDVVPTTPPLKTKRALKSATSVLTSRLKESASSMASVRKNLFSNEEENRNEVHKPVPTRKPKARTKNEEVKPKTERVTRSTRRNRLDV